LIIRNIENITIRYSISNKHILHMCKISVCINVDSKLLNANW